jgi:hypothetical protein
MKDGSVIPIEVKWTDSPKSQDAKNIEKFVAENKQECNRLAVKGSLIEKEFP